MRKIVAITICLAVLLSACSFHNHILNDEQHSLSSETNSSTNSFSTELNSSHVDSNSSNLTSSNSNKPLFNSLNDPGLLAYVEDEVYDNLIYDLDNTNYFIENVSAQYISKEYIEEVSYNSLENVFFGYTLSELDNEFQGIKYVFTLGDDGTTVVKAFENYDNTYVNVLKDVAIGTGVILICVTVSAVTGGTAPAISMVFAASAKTGSVFALSSGALSGVAAGVVTGMETKNFDQALKAGIEAGSESFKWGAISGTILGGTGEAIALHGATLHGLTMNEAAIIQRESHYPLDVVKEFSSIDQYYICRDAGLFPARVDAKTVSLIREIDLKSIVDDMGRTNAQRIADGLSPLDPNGVAYELHHIGQKADSTLAILTKAEHMQNGNNKIWHEIGKETEVHGPGNTWAAERTLFWEEYLEYAISGGI